MLFIFDEDYNYIIDGDIEIINEMKSKSQYAWEKWKKHYNFKPFKTDKTGRVGTIEVDGRTIKADMRTNEYRDKTKQKKRSPSITHTVHIDKNGNRYKVSHRLNGSKHYFKNSFKDAKLMTDHEIGHAIDKNHSEFADKHGNIDADNEEHFDRLINDTKYFKNALELEKPDQNEHANVDEGVADRYAANKNGTKNMRGLIKRLRKYRDKDIRKNHEINKYTKIDKDVRLKMLKDPLLGSYKLDGEKKDYGKDVIKNPKSNNVSKKHRNMNQERQEKKKKKFKYDD